MKSLTDYLTQVKKEYKFTVRVAESEISDKDMDRLEANLKAFELKKLSAPKVTMFQKHALGFAEPNMSEVTIFNVTVALPITSQQLQILVAKVFKISTARVVVNGQDNPLNVATTTEE